MREFGRGREPVIRPSSIWPPQRCKTAVCLVTGRLVELDRILAGEGQAATRLLRADRGFGALQAVGLTMTILGFAIQTDVEVPAAALLGDGGQARAVLTPALVGSGMGVSLALYGAD